MTRTRFVRGRLALTRLQPRRHLPRRPEMLSAIVLRPQRRYQGSRKTARRKVARNDTNPLLPGTLPVTLLQSDEWKVRFTPVPASFPPERTPSFCQQNFPAIMQSSASHRRMSNAYKDLLRTSPLYPGIHPVIPP